MEFRKAKTETQKMRFETELFSSDARTSFELADLVDMLNSTGLKIIDTNHQLALCGKNVCITLNSPPM
jgi:hypothetical protein